MRPGLLTDSRFGLRWRCSLHGAADCACLQGYGGAAYGHAGGAGSASSGGSGGGARGAAAGYDPLAPVSVEQLNNVYIHRHMPTYTGACFTLKA